MKSRWQWAAAVVALGVAMFSTSHGGTNQVFPVRMTLRGVIERGVISNEFIQDVKITSDDLINLAMHRQLGTPVPANEILALVNDCTIDSARLIVFDASEAINLVTVGTFSNLVDAADVRKQREQTITQLTIANTSEGGTNGITGGSFYYAGNLSTETNGCVRSFGGNLTGFLGTAFPVVITNIFTTNDITGSVTNRVTVTNIFDSVDGIVVVIPRTPLGTGKSIGNLIEP